MNTIYRVDPRSTLFFAYIPLPPVGTGLEVNCPQGRRMD